MAKNVLFILTDDQRYDTIGALGNPEILTPHMDWLVQNGTAFTQAHIPGGTTGAVCMPSRAMLVTGRSLFRIEKEGQNIPPEHVTMAEVFRAGGYETFAAGKWHNGIDSFQRGFESGANLFFGGMWDHWCVPTCVYDPTGEYDNVVDVTVNFTTSNATRSIHADHFNHGIHSSELLSDTAMEFLDHREKERPFFLYLSYLAPHDPRVMPRRFKEMYDPENISLPPNYRSEHPFPIGIEAIRDERLASYPRNEEEVRQHLAEYYGMISHLDHEIGRVLDKLKEAGELDNTVIVFTGDNGLAVGCHGLMGKQSNYEHSVRVPLIMAGNGIPKGKTISNYVYLFDVFPSLCTMLGLPIPDSVDGMDFTEMFQNDSFRIRESLYFAYADLIRSVKDERYKYIQYRFQGETVQLFDLQRDPYEQEDLSKKEEYRQLIQDMKLSMAEFCEVWEEKSHVYGRKYWDEEYSFCETRKI